MEYTFVEEILHTIEQKRINEPCIGHSQGHDPNRPVAVTIGMAREDQRNDHGVCKIEERQCSGDASLIEILSVETGFVIWIILQFRATRSQRILLSLSSFIQSEQEPGEKEEKGHLNTSYIEMIQNVQHIQI